MNSALSFDEFRAVRNREKNIVLKDNSIAEAKQNSKSDSKSSSSKNNITNSTANSSANSNETTNSNTTNKNYFSDTISSIGEFLEMHQMQIFTVTLILLDTFSGFLELYLTTISTGGTTNSADVASTSSSNRASSVWINTWSRSLKSFGSFTIFFFITELFGLLLVFGLKLFTHWGYLLDMFTISTMVHLESIGYTKKVN